VSDLGAVILAHGSRVPETLRTLEDIACQVKRAGSWLIEPAALQFNEPDLEQAVARLVARGATRIVVLPMFLFGGNHVLRDIPLAVETVAAKHVGVSVSLGRHVGADYRLSSILVERLREAAAEPGQNGACALLRPEEIEGRSFEIIEASGCLSALSAAEKAVVRRVVHAGGDLGLSELVFFSPNATQVAMTALRSGHSIITDVNMVATGVNKHLATRLGVKIQCLIDSPEIARMAEQEGMTRAATAVRELVQTNPEAIVVVGNAPTALREVLRLSAAGADRPAFVVGMPVGFVDAAESKEALRGSDVEHIGIAGTRGGSGLAAAAANALLKLALEED